MCLALQAPLMCISSQIYSLHEAAVLDSLLALWPESHGRGTLLNPQQWELPSQGSSNRTARPCRAGWCILCLVANQSRVEA